MNIDENILKYESEIAFGWVHMIGEIGGIIGMCLGWSVLSFLEMMNHFGGRVGANSSILKKTNIGILILIFFYWSYDTFRDYDQQTEAMELLLETDINPPYVTICDGVNEWVPHFGVKNTVFQEWLNLKYSCSLGYPNYKDAIMECLKHSQDGVLLI